MVVIVVSSKFIPHPGMVMVGADLEGLELRALGHYLSPFDHNAFADVVVNGELRALENRLDLFTLSDIADERKGKILSTNLGQRLGNFNGNNGAVLLYVNGLVHCFLGFRQLEPMTGPGFDRVIRIDVGNGLGQKFAA